MNLSQLSFYEQAILVLSALVLYTSFALLARSRLLGLINLFALVIFCYYVTLPVEQLSLLVTRNTIAISLANVLLSMLLMISRRQAISQVVGFMAMENGLFFAALVSTYGMPMVVELGIAFDVLVAAILFGVFFFHIRDNICGSNESITGT